ncbi:MAG: tRNA dihydrouridine synthase DusB [Turicibacter sp.]|nr:tRNA dihydrouridine synthase DusB [Turicibacter sp.]
MNLYNTELLEIGQVKIPGKIFLAPMAGITDRSFRQICQELGCGLAYSEMVSTKSILYGKVKFLLDKTAKNAPHVIQIFGKDPDIMAKAASILEADIIDINMGCPAPKIVKNMEGSALMRSPALVGKIVESVVQAVKVPVTVKMRTGWDAQSINAVEIAKIAEEAGAAAVTVHGRTRNQFYSGKADWSVIAAVKAALKIPVIANGDIDSKTAAEAVIKQTNCDAIMIGRAACGNPWLFNEIATDAAPPSWNDRIQLALRHLKMCIEHKGEHTGVLEMRKHLSFYIKGLHEATKLRIKINKALKYEELEDLLESAVRDLSCKNLP